jgi:hypothetical protein
VSELDGGVEGEEPAAHRLYLRLNDELGDAAHSRYNAILARVAKFTRVAGVFEQASPDGLKQRDPRRLSP